MHVVVVDPSSIVHRVITSVLAPRGYQLTAFSDSEEALRFVEDDQSVDVVLTSLEMTPMPGLELCWHIRNLGRSIYSIAMSSQASSKSLAEALDSGADDFVEKPPKPEALLARLRAAGCSNVGPWGWTTQTGSGVLVGATQPKTDAVIGWT